MSGDQLQMKSKRILGVTWFFRSLYQILFLSRFGSIAGAQPKNVARDNPLYGDIKVLSAVKTIFGVPIFLPKRMPKPLILNLAGVTKLDFL